MKLYRDLLPRRIPILGALVVAVLVLVTYRPALDAGFLADDYEWLDWAGRLPLDRYLVHYFDPRVQTQWFRPLQGIQWWITYHLLSNEPAGYHLWNILLHLANCLLLYRLVGRLSHRWYIALLAAALFAVLSPASFDAQLPGRPPIELLRTHYADAIIWPAVVDPLLALMSLLAMDFWLTFLRSGNRTLQILTLAAVVAALLTKETGVMVLPLLFLMDRLLLPRHVSAAELTRRYLFLLLPLLPYVPLAFMVQKQSVFTVFQGYGMSNQVLTNIVRYLEALAFPWASAGPASLLWLVFLTAVILYAVVRKGNLAVLFLSAAATLPVLPVSPFGAPLPRYLYIPMMAWCTGFALLTDRVLLFLHGTRRTRVVAILAFTVLLLANSRAAVTETAYFTNTVAQAWAPFESIVAKYPRPAPDTLLYFVDPPIYSLELSGFFLTHYGPGVTVSGTDQAKRADLHRHASAFVIYFDEDGNTREQEIYPAIPTSIQPDLPVRFQAPIEFVGYEIANNPTRAGNSIILISYWRPTGVITKNFTIFAHLVDQDSRLIESYDSEPQSARAPTTSWKLIPSPSGAAKVIPSAAIIPTRPDLAPGEYRIEMGLYYLPTMERLRIMDAEAISDVDRIVINPIHIDRTQSEGAQR